jgi:hypothetical protein
LIFALHLAYYFIRASICFFISNHERADGNMAVSFRIAAILLVCPTLAGCGDVQHIARPARAGIASESLIDDISRSHHFGAVISEPGRKLEHSYPLRNKTRHAIKIVDVVNRKPCCGEIRIGRTTLEPEEETGVRVALSVNQEFGDIIHETVVLTRPSPTRGDCPANDGEGFPAGTLRGSGEG